MGLIINQEKINTEVAEQLIKICPFNALSYEDGKMSVNAACKSCKLCVKKGPAGAITWEDEKVTKNDKKCQSVLELLDSKTAAGYNKGRT